jgi:orotate phosphoribosyltransferase
MPARILDFLFVRKGHFRLESGHHGDLWLDVEGLFVHPHRIKPFITNLAEELSAHEFSAVCGPAPGGAFLAQSVATALKKDFYFTERVPPEPSAELYSTAYRSPPNLRKGLRKKRVAVVDDVINAGSAVRATIADLLACGAVPVVIGSFLVLGGKIASFAAEYELPIHSLAQLANNVWSPAECPLCAARIPISDPQIGLG